MTEITLQPAELEIGLHRLRADAHQVELRFINPASEAEVNPVKGDARFDMDELSALEANPHDYGKSLAAMLFADAQIRSMYQQVRSSVDSLNVPLRVRLLVGPTAPGLHRLRWELLTDPAGQSHLFTSERTLFSRFMTSSDWRTVRLRPKAEMNAVIAVAAPGNLESYRLAPVDLASETARARETMGRPDHCRTRCHLPVRQGRWRSACRWPRMVLEAAAPRGANEARGSVPYESAGQPLRRRLHGETDLPIARVGRNVVNYLNRHS